MMTGYGFGFGGVLMMGFWILFLVFVVAGIVWLVSTLSRPQTRLGDSGSSALRILEERLARGEIDADEFRTRRTAIEGVVR
jgi:putative membrane protein